MPCNSEQKVDIERIVNDEFINKLENIYNKQFALQCMEESKSHHDTFFDSQCL